jgi:hypothetical protein
MKKKPARKFDLQFFASDPMDLTLEQALTSNDLLVYSRNVAVDTEYLHPLLFPPKETSELTVDVLRSESNNIPVMAKIAELGTEIEYASREGLSGTRVEIPKIQLGRYLDERLVRLALQSSGSFGLRPQEISQLRNKQFDDAGFVVDAIHARKEWIAMKLLATGGVNYVEGDVRVIVDYGYTNDQKPILSGTDKWSDLENSTPLTDIQTWVGQMRDLGIVVSRALTSTRVVSLLLQNKSIRLQYHGNPSGSANPPQLNRAQLNSVLTDLGLPRIAVNDKMLKSENRALTNGKVTYTAARTFEDSRFILMPEGPLGNYLWAQTTEEMLAADIPAERTGDMGLYVFRDVTKNPIRVRTAGVALNFPAFGFADSVVSATVL